MKTNDSLTQSEQAVIGCLIRDNDCFDESKLTASDFFNHSHKIIFSAIKSFLDAGKPVDLIMLFEYLDKHDELEKVGGMAYITELVQSVGTTKNFKYHVGNIQDKSKLRLLKSFLAEMESSVNEAHSAGELIEKSESGLFNLLENKEESEIISLKQAVAEAVDWEESEHKGVQTGLRDLDRLTGGFCKSNMIVIAGRPSMGKSALAVQIAEHVSQSGYVIVFSLEMSAREIGSRFLGHHKHRVGISQAITHSVDLNMGIDGKAGVTLQHIRSQCRKAKRKHGLEMIVIDYLQLMQGSGDNRTQEIGAISRGLKAIAKEFDIPVVVLSQLSRKVEDRTNKRPLMSDLRDSGEIEQDADLILLIYREEAYNKETDNKGIAEIICRKNRNGSTGDILTRFTGETTRFSDCDGERIIRFPTKQKERGFSI